MELSKELRELIKSEAASMHPDSDYEQGQATLLMKLGAVLALESTGWISVEERLPEKKEGWNHSERYLVQYADGNYGISYYNYDPPFKTAGMWVDFANYGKQPALWQPVALLPKKP